MKRSLVVLLTIAMLLFAFAGIATAAEQDDAAQRLQDFNIIEGYEDGSLGLDREITRAEFAKIAVMAKGMEEAAELLVDSSTPFSDVKTGVWYTGWINVAYSQNIIQGDPAGTFRPNDNISNAEAVAMILRVLGYGENLPGVWPNNYLVKGAELGVTTGIVSNASAKAVRGDVFTMLNRALDEEVVKWDSDEAEYVEKDFTLLQEMLSAKEEAEGRVVATYRTDSKLDENEIRVRTEDGIKTFELMFDADVDYLLGLEVTVKHDAGDAYYVEVDTEDADIMYDTVDGNADEDKVTLYVEDDDFDWAENATVFVNFSSEDPEDVTSGLYGKFVLDGDGDVAFAVLFDFNADNSGVVTGFDDDDIIEYVSVEANEEELDLGEYDDIYVFAPDFKDASIDDIDVDSAIFFWTDDDEIYIIVKNEKVEGHLDRARDNTVRIDGTNFDVADNAAATLDLSDSFVVWGEVSDISDLIDEDVYIVLDLNGEAMFISGDVDVTSDTIYGVVTWAEKGRNSEITVFTEAGEEVTYVFEERNDLPNALVAGASGLEYDETEYVVVKFELNKDGEIDEGSAVFVVVDGTNLDIEQVYGPDSNGDYGIIASADYDDYDVYGVTLTKGSDDKFVRDGVGGPRYYISKDTVMIKALDDNELDPSLQKYDGVIASAFAADGEAVVFSAGPGRNADAIVFLSNNFVGTSDDLFYGVVVDRPWKQGSDWYVDIDVFGEGIDEYLLEDEGDFSKGTLVTFRINSNDEAEAVANAPIPGTIAEKDGNDVRIGSTWYKLDSNAVVYELEDGDLEDKTRVSRIREGSEVMLLLDRESEEVLAALLVIGDAPGTRSDFEFEVGSSSSAVLASDNVSRSVRVTVYVDGLDADWDGTGNHTVTIDRNMIDVAGINGRSITVVDAEPTGFVNGDTIEFTVVFTDDIYVGDQLNIAKGAIKVVGDGQSADIERGSISIGNPGI